MLSYNKEDFHLEDICGKMVKDFSKFSAKDYYVYGLADTPQRPHISIGTTRATPSLTKLVGILRNNGLVAEVIQPKCVGHRRFKVALGLRKDVRESITTTRSIIAAIAYAAENNLVVEENFKFNIAVKPSDSRMEKISEDKQEPTNVSISSVSPFNV